MSSMIRAALVAGAAAGLVLTAGATAQGPSQEKLKELRAEKLAKEVFQKTPWLFDYDAARAKAKEEGKLLFTYFTRSYAN